MTAHFTRSHVKEHAHIGIPITTPTYNESLAVPVSSIMNQFSYEPVQFGKLLVGITSDDGPTWRDANQFWKVTLTNTVDFDLGKSIFVMERISHVLANYCKAVVMDVKSDNGKVDTEVARKNMKNNHRRKQRL